MTLHTMHRREIAISIQLVSFHLFRQGQVGLKLLCLILRKRIRIDRGTETGIMATIHSFLRSQTGDLKDASESVLYGSSTHNNIERQWHEFLERLENFFKIQLSILAENGDYDPSDETDRQLLPPLIYFQENLSEQYLKYNTAMFA